MEPALTYGTMFPVLVLIRSNRFIYYSLFYQHYVEWSLNNQLPLFEIRHGVTDKLMTSLNVFEADTLIKIYCTTEDARMKIEKCSKDW